MTQEMSQHAVLSSRSRGQKRVSKTCIARCTARECAVNSDLSIATNLLAAHSSSSVDKMQLSLAADDQVSGLAPLLTWRNRWYLFDEPADPLRNLFAIVSFDTALMSIATVGQGSLDQTMLRYHLLSTRHTT